MGTSHLKAAIDDKSVDISVVNNALVNLYVVQMRLGLFDPSNKQPYRSITTSSIDTKAHQELALEAARQGMVLLKNDDNALPLDPSTFKNIAVIGPNGNATGVLQGNYQGTAPYLISPVMGINRFAKAYYTQGCDMDCANPDIDAINKAATDADATVLVVGLDQTQESEGHDRTSISLPGKQTDVIKAAAEAAHAHKGKKVILL